MKAVITLEVDIDMEETEGEMTPADVASMFKETAEGNIKSAIGNGLLTGDSPLVIDTWSLSFAMDSPMMVNQSDRLDAKRRYSVFLRPILGVRTEVFDACSAKEAYDKAREGIDFDQLFNTPTSSHELISSIQYSEEVCGALIDQIDDDGSYIEGEGYPVTVLPDVPKPF